MCSVWLYTCNSPWSIFSQVKLRLLPRVSSRKVSATQPRIWRQHLAVDLQSTSLSPFFSWETVKRGSRVCCATQNTSIPSHDTKNCRFSAQISAQELARASVLFLNHTTVIVMGGLNLLPTNNAIKLQVHFECPHKNATNSRGIRVSVFYNTS